MRFNPTSLPLPAASTRNASLQNGSSGRNNTFAKAVIATVGLALTPTLLLAATAPSLGTNAAHVITASTLNQTATSTLTGNGCYTTLAGTPDVFSPPGTVPCPAQRGLDQNAAVASLNGQTCTSLGGGAVALETANVGSGAGVFPPGCYSSGGAMSVGANITLNGAGVYIFRPSGTLTTTNNTNIAVSGGACESDVFWVPTAATTLGANTTFKGTIFDTSNAVSVGSTTSMIGRILTPGGVVNINTDTITRPTCTTAVPTGIPTLAEWALITFALLIVGVGLFKQKRTRESF